MNEYQFSISLNGSFLFRTEWISDSNLKDQTWLELRKRFLPDEGFKITVYERSRVMRDVTKEFI